MITRERINYTGRIDLESHEVEATYRVENDHVDLTIKWLLGDYGLPKDCKLVTVIVAPGKSTEFIRIELGDLGEGQGEKTLQLKVRNPELIGIRFIVIQLNSDVIPILKAYAEVRPDDLGENSRARSFLKIIKDENLTVPWQVKFEYDLPYLAVPPYDDLFPDLALAKNLFIPTVLPEVVRQIFEWLATSEVDLNNKTIMQWIKFFEKLSCKPDFFESSHSRGNEEAYNEVVTKAIEVSEEFSKKFAIIQLIKSAFETEENS